jgi:hypothetical protein
MADWKAQGLPVEQSLAAEFQTPGPSARERALAASRRRWWDVLIDSLGERSIGGLLLVWLWMTLGFGLLYWVSGALFGHALRGGGAPIGAGWDGLASAIYFSFVTALSIGYGDIVPVGALRILAILEGAAGLLLFGCVISKFVSRRQEELTAEIHRIAFEDRLGRVRTNLHLVLSDLQAIAHLCAAEGLQPQRVLTRVESAASVFAGVLQTVHDLLYRPQQVPPEEVLESILANIAADLRELGDVLGSAPGGQRTSATLRANLRSIRALANEICGECVPRAYAPALRDWMDRVHDLAGNIA